MSWLWDPLLGSHVSSLRTLVEHLVRVVFFFIQKHSNSFQLSSNSQKVTLPTQIQQNQTTSTDNGLKNQLLYANGGKGFKGGGW